MVAISAIDTKNRINTTYINEGLEFTGDSLLTPETHELYYRAGNQHPLEIITLIQEDRRFNVWTDQNGYLWHQNNHNTWIQDTRTEPSPRMNDPSSNSMTRNRSNFDNAIALAKEKALIVFDSSQIINSLYNNK